MATKQDLLKNVQKLVDNKPSAATGERQPSINYAISTLTPVGEVTLPELAGTLSEKLQGIARLYIGARRRSGEALLEAARWLSEARVEAQHGEWGVFLAATQTSDDTAERLLNIHTQAMQNPQFAESVRTNWIGQSVAALLAAPSTPQQVIEEALNAPESPTVGEIRRKIKDAKTPNTAEEPPKTRPAYRTRFSVNVYENPQIADFEHGETPGHPTLTHVLQEVALTLGEVEQIAMTLDVGEQAEHALEQIEQAVLRIRHTLEERRADR
jgi:hypothetical protein